MTSQQHSQWSVEGKKIGEGEGQKQQLHLARQAGRLHFPLSKQQLLGRLVLHSAEMGASAWGFFGAGLLLCSLLGLVWSGRQMDKLAEKKLCADAECDHPISIAVALQDYIAPDCRFINIQRGQIVYVFSKLKGRGRLFWGGSVEGDYYGEQASLLGYFPSSVIQERQYLKPGKVEVKTSRWDFYCQ
ncbi:hypothetical protein JRQ81_012059 [Phrynocephalus forsythii]|uniref:SH3 domain-containing protein n=1 Tax=Phrynocephalus forsythii TaxID=171643 RepID=A0A9Q0X8X1_9SAUR|nr:hypothetical protein JRQ81_012059 [Phrynocephalus forsythii]